MKNPRRFVVGLALALVAIALPKAAMAGSIFHFQGRFAEAYFDSLDSANCIDTAVYVFAEVGKSQSPPGPGISGVITYGFISKYDYCGQTQLLGASFYSAIPSSDFKLDENLNSAQLTTTVSVFDYISGTSFPVSLALTWTAAGPAIRNNFGFHVHAPGFTANEHDNGVTRVADATGTVSDGTTNFTPQASLYGGLDSAKDGMVQIY
jgi:hypothetical protein